MPGLVPQQTATSLLEQCLPLYTLLAALGNPTVHWFILDIEGAELQVLHADLLIMITAHTALTPTLSGAEDHPLGPGGHRAGERGD